MSRRRSLIIGVALTTAALIFATISAPEVETPATTQGNCAYQWAYQDAVELTQFIDEAAKALNQEASARAQYYGEDCIYADGTSTFSAMETDFYIRLPVDDLTKEEEFGDFVAQVMEIVTQIPREELSGNYGFVEFWFEKSTTEHITFRVPIQQYIDEAQGKSGVELFQLFYSQP